VALRREASRPGLQRAAELPEPALPAQALQVLARRLPRR